MKPLTIKTFKPDMIKAVNSEQKKAGEINYTSVKFEYSSSIGVGGTSTVFLYDGPVDPL